MIAHIEFAIAHEPVETSIGILERATKDTISPSVIQVIRHFMFLVFRRASENQYE